MNKLATATTDLTKLQYPLKSWLLVMGTHQWLVPKVSPNWEGTNIKDREFLLGAIDGLQNNVSLALSCIQAQLWVHSITALIIREGEEGAFPTEIWKIVWDKATDLEQKLQSWWRMVNFPYDPTTNIVRTVVLSIRNASLYTIHPILALGVNHEGAVFYPLEHRRWAQRTGNKWHTVDLESCIMQDQQGFICESNAVNTRGICLDTEQKICHFEARPDIDPKPLVIYVGKGCACLRTPCKFIFVENIKVDTGNYSNLCICNFTQIKGCDFNYSAPVTSYSL